MYSISRDTPITQHVLSFRDAGDNRDIWTEAGRDLGSTGLLAYNLPERVEGARRYHAIKCGSESHLSPGCAAM
jgi:hypothetical protein